MANTEAIESKIKELIMQVIRQHGLDLNRINKAVSLKSLVLCGGDQKLTIQLTGKVINQMKNNGDLDGYMPS